MLARVGLLGLVFVLAVPAAVRSQPVGPHFPINSHTAGEQDQLAIAFARDAKNGFIAVWRSDHDEGGDRTFTGRGKNGIFARIFDRHGNPLGPDFRVNTAIDGSQETPAVAATGDGEFVVVWMGHGDGGSYSNYYYYNDPTPYPTGEYGIFAQRLDAAGNLIGGEFPVNTWTDHRQGWPSVSADEKGDFVVVWTSGYYGDAYPRSNSIMVIVGRRFESDGTPLSGEFEVNTGSYYPYTNASGGAVASGKKGEFLVVWQRPGVTAQAFDPTGSPNGTNFQITTTSAYNSGGKVSATGKEGFVVVYTVDPSKVFGRRIAVNGNFLGLEFLVDTSASTQGSPCVAGGPKGEFAITWRDFDSNTTLLRGFNANGEPVGSELMVPGPGGGGFWGICPSFSPKGEILIGGQGFDDGASTGLFGQWFQSLPKK